MFGYAPFIKSFPSWAEDKNPPRDAAAQRAETGSYEQQRGKRAVAGLSKLRALFPLPNVPPGRLHPVTDFELTYVVMIFLYVMECCALIPECGTLFTRVFSRWRINRLPGCAFAGGKRLVLLPPLPFAGEWHVAALPDATVTDIGIVTVNSLREYPQGLSNPGLLKFGDPAAEPYLQAFAAAGYAIPGKRTVLPFDKNPGKKDKTDSAPAPAPELAHWVDSGPARERFGRLRSGLGLLKILCTMQFLWAFAGAPLLLRYFSLEGMVLPYLFVLYWLGGTIAASFAYVHRRVYGQRWKTLGKALWLFVYPLAAMRAVQIVCNNALPPCHESAVAEALMNRRAASAEKNVESNNQGEQPDLSDAATHYLADITAKLRHRLFFQSLTAEASLALAKANERLLQAIYANWKASPPSPLHDPANLEKEATRYCPVCGIGMAAVIDRCPHCLEVKTRER